MDFISLLGGNAYEHYIHSNANMVNGKPVSDEEFQQACEEVQSKQLDDEAAVTHHPTEGGSL